MITVNDLSLLQMAKTDNTDVSGVLLQYMALQLYKMFSSLVVKMENDLARDIAVHKVTLMAMLTKVLNDPEFSRIDGLANVSCLSELFTCLQPHYGFLSWKAISLLSNCLKEEGYFKLVELFEKYVEIRMFSNALSLIPQRSVSSSLACSELTLSLHTQWGTQSMFNLRNSVSCYSHQ